MTTFAPGAPSLEATVLVVPYGYPDRPSWACADLPYMVRRVDNDFPADIIGLQVAEHGADARVVTVTGEIDTLTAPKLASFLNEQLFAAQVVVVDLDGVEFLGSAGLSALFEANELANRERRALRMVCHSRIANRALEATELRSQFTFADTVPEALKHST